MTLTLSPVSSSPAPVPSRPYVRRAQPKLSFAPVAFLPALPAGASNAFSHSQRKRHPHERSYQDLTDLCTSQEKGGRKDKRVHPLSDDQLARSLHFVNEIGNGNWGSVWLAVPKSRQASSHSHSARKSRAAKSASSPNLLQTGSREYAEYDTSADTSAGDVKNCDVCSSLLKADYAHARSNGTRVAIKLVHRKPNDQDSAVRCNSLWNEMQVISYLKSFGNGQEALHESVVDMYSFVVTESYAMVVM